MPNITKQLEKSNAMNSFLSIMSTNGLFCGIIICNKVHKRAKFAKFKYSPLKKFA